MGLNLSGLQIAQELDINKDDARAMIGQLRQGTVERRPPVVLEGEVECDEVYVVAGHKATGRWKTTLKGVTLPRSDDLTVSLPIRATTREGSIETFDALIRSGARRLTGFQRRAFPAEVATELGDGNARQAGRRFGWGRDTLEEGLHE